MTDLSRLKVSLTKHNAHKIAYVLKKHRVEHVLDRLDAVQADRAQTYKNLSVLPEGKLPDVWAKAKKLGDKAIDSLVFIGIVFSHIDLISAMAAASERNRFVGRIERGKQLEGKAYTNFARVIDQLGFAARIDLEGVTFDLASIFDNPSLGSLVGELLDYKLTAALWPRTNSLAEEAVANDFHKVFGITKDQFREWIIKDIQPVRKRAVMLPKDDAFFFTEENLTNSRPYSFSPGHVERAVNALDQSASLAATASQLHNDIQNRLYTYLCGKLGKASVGTEIKTGYGASIDLVTVEVRNSCEFERNN